jgi:hypothetical protein
LIYTQPAPITVPAISPSVTKIPNATPTPTFLFHGNVTYNIGRGSAATGPNAKSLTLEPLDPAVGSTQSFIVSINYTEPVTLAYLSMP